jgi:hypothetical protein
MRALWEDAIFTFSARDLQSLGSTELIQKIHKFFDNVFNFWMYNNHLKLYETGEFIIT